MEKINLELLEAEILLVYKKLCILENDAKGSHRFCSDQTWLDDLRREASELIGKVR